MYWTLRIFTPWHALVAGAGAVAVAVATTDGCSGAESGMQVGTTGQPQAGTSNGTGGGQGTSGSAGESGGMSPGGTSDGGAGAARAGGDIVAGAGGASGAGGDSGEPHVYPGCDFVGATCAGFFGPYHYVCTPPFNQKPMGGCALRATTRSATARRGVLCTT